MNPMNPPPFTASRMYMPQQAMAPQQPLAPPQQLPPLQQQLPPPQQPGVMSNRARPASVREERPTSMEYQGYTWTLEVVQQPLRARMCGFGDKDRRPITPPPVILLTVADARTGRKLTPDELPDLDCSHFVINVDLWDQGKVNESILVRASSNTPTTSISSASYTAYPPTEQAMPPRPAHMMMSSDGSYSMPYAMHGYSPMPMTNAYGYPAGGAYYPSLIGGYYGQHNQHANSNYTRNLIGSLSVNAARLKDNTNETGFYFVLQDLSVRMEGDFRLRVNFVNLSDGKTPPSLNRGKCPILSWVFTEPFKVFSAKKFPGVIESTELSKTFARQGVKIPIRKDNGGKNDGGGRDDDDDGE